MGRRREENMGRRREEKVGRQASLSFAQIQIKAAPSGRLFSVGGQVVTNRLAVKLMDIHDLQFALRISADQKVEGCISPGVPGTVRNCPPEWLIHNKPISASQPRYFSFSSRRPFSDGPLTMVLLRRSLDIR